MSSAHIDEALMAEVASRLDLREPNRAAIESVLMMTSQHFDVDGGDAPYECIVDSATGVGKTYVLAGLVEYLAGAQVPARNFLLLAPGRTIRDKSIQNFTPGHRKSLTAAMRSRPFLVTSDNFDTAATHAVMIDPGRTKLFVFTVQALTSRDGEGRRTHEFVEGLGGSFFNHLAGLDDLVILADEHHCYRGAAFSSTIRQLRPEVVIGLTATPSRADEAMIVYRYPLAQAIADQHVKTPVLVGRRDDRRDDETKLLDGVTLLRHKERLAHAYCEENDLVALNPVMLVVAQDIEQAERLQTILDSSSFDGGAWAGKTLLVHSKLTGESKERALADLEAVEAPGSPVRVIISVGMLKEGWDVKNVYVIASMRASVSDVLTEQTLGRGMRLPFGSYTGIEMLDTVEVLAHERYEELLAKREALNEKFVDHAILIQLRQTSAGTVARRTVLGTEAQVIPETATDADAAAVPPALTDTQSRIETAERAAYQEATAARDHYPVPGRPEVLIPYVEPTQQPTSVSLNQVDDDAAFSALGRALATESDTDLRRTLLRSEGGRIKGVTAEGSVAASTFDIELEVSRSNLIEYVMHSAGVQRRPNELSAAKRLVDLVIEGMGTDAAVYLSAYYTRCARRLSETIIARLTKFASQHVTFTDEVKTAALDGKRTTRKRHDPRHTDTFDRGVAYDGWSRCLYPYAWFDSSPEYRAAQAIDGGRDVVVWARLLRNDLPITWTQQGREYNPDFVVVEETDAGRVSWLVETKMSKEMGAADVLAKRTAAKTWANTVNSSGVAEGTWRYLLLSEDDVRDAGGQWDQMKAFGT